ncbi:hypothetical protein EK904_003432 [Melospiza melodia maxima]|nr:hypothetical protein EK904_003432 [Melospiza melodia maxima]
MLVMSKHRQDIKNYGLSVAVEKMKVLTDARKDKAKKRKIKSSVVILLKSSKLKDCPDPLLSIVLAANSGLKDCTKTKKNCLFFRTAYITGDLQLGLHITSIILFTLLLLCEAGNFSIHVALSDLRRNGKNCVIIFSFVQPFSTSFSCSASGKT